MRYDSSWLQNRIDSIRQMAAPDSQLKTLAFGGNTQFGYAIRVPMGGGAIKEIRRGTLRECLAYLDGILFVLTEIKEDAKQNNLMKSAMGSTLPIGHMSEIKTNGDITNLASKFGYQEDLYSSTNDAIEYLNNFAPPGYWIGWNNEDGFGVWPDGDLTD